MAKIVPPENEEERRAWIKRQKAKGVRVFKARYGWVASAAPLPANPRTADQQSHRSNVRAVPRRWSKLTLDQQAAWRVLAASAYLITETGERVRRNCYQLFTSLNVRRADLGLPQFSDPPTQAVFSTQPVFELMVAKIGDRVTIELCIRGSTAQFIVVQAARLKKSGVRVVQHFPFLALLSAPTDGTYDLTELFVARYGVPKVDQAVWIRAFQHTDGWIDVPQVLRARVLPPAA
jgi:hypothetical protein